MVSSIMNNLRLTSPDAETFFPNIHGDGFHNDNTFLAMLRALLRNRVPKETQVNLVVRDFSVGSGITNEEILDAVKAAADLETPYTITFLNMKRDAFEGVDKALQEITVPNHTYMPMVVKAAPSVAFWCDHDKANTLVVVKDMVAYSWHNYSAFFRKFYFKNLLEEQPLSENEMSILKCFTGKEDQSKEFIRLMEEIADEYDFYGVMVRRTITNITSSTYKTRIKNLNDSITRCNTDMRKYRDELAKQLAKRENLMIELAGLEARDRTEQDKELMEYFVNNRALYFDHSSGEGVMYYWVKTDLTYWDEVEAECGIKSPGSMLYHGCSQYGINTEKFKKLLTAIFIDRSVIVQMCCSYHLKFNSDRIDVWADNEVDRPACMGTYLSNPHGMIHECMGTFGNALEDAMDTGNIPGAIDVTIAATSQLNLTDVSTKGFSDYLCASNEKCLRLSDGTLMTCREYLDTLED